MEPLEQRQMLSVNVGYYDMWWGSGVSQGQIINDRYALGQEPAITDAGQTPVQMTGVTADDLDDIKVLLVQSGGGSTYGELSQHKNEIWDAVDRGMVLVLNDPLVTGASTVLPGGAGIQTTYQVTDKYSSEPKGPDYYIDLPVDTPNDPSDDPTSLTNGQGPKGAIGDATLDGDILYGVTYRSSHGYALASSLPANAKKLLVREDSEDHVVAFSYRYGNGAVVYSTIPMGWYVDYGYASNITSIYAPNVVAYAASLVPRVSLAAPNPIEEGQPLSLSAEGHSSAQPLTYTWTVNHEPVDASGANPTIDWNTLVASGVMDDGTYEVSVQMTDGDNRTASASRTFTVTNAAPVVEAGSDITIDEGSTLIRGSFTDPGHDTWTAVVDYGDGTTAEFALAAGADVLNHVYRDNGTYTVTVSVTDDDGGAGTDTLAVTVNNVAPAVTIDGPAAVDQGQAFGGSGSFTDPGADTWTATVDYGDGAAAEDITLNADGTFNFSHIFAESGDYTVTVNVMDDEQAVGTGTLTVTVGATAPIVNAGDDGSVDEGSLFSREGYFAASGEGWTATVDYGDGAGPQELLLNADKTFALDHRYADNGVYSVTVTVTDGDDRAASDTLAVTVNNVAPAVTVSDSQTMVPGETAYFEITGIADPGSADTFPGQTWEVLSGTTVVASGTGDEVEFTPTATGSYTVRFTVTDDDGGVGVGTAQLTVSTARIQPDPVYGGSMLVVGGGSGGDSVDVAAGADGQVRLTVNGVSQGVFAPTSRVVVYGGAGNDRLRVASAVRLSVWLYGGEGNDELRGGGGNDVIMGGEGTDLVFGDSGRDFIVGGVGADLMLGNSEDDILIAGEIGTVAVDGVMDLWSSGQDYQARVAAIQSMYLRQDIDVFDDGDFDIVAGNQGMDLFFANVDRPGRVVDWVIDARRSESVVDIDANFSDAIFEETLEL